MTITSWKLLVMLTFKGTEIELVPEVHLWVS